MNERIQRIYIELYKKPSTKQYLSELFSITSKTIENTIKTIDEIIYDKQIGAYRFICLLPSFIPYEIFMMLCEDSIANKLVQNDFKTISRKLENSIVMLSTRNLSSLSKKIIQVTLAINHSCILKMEYKSMKGIEIKYIKPHKIVCTDFTYYLLASYDTSNKKNIGKMRSYAFNGILSIEPFDYLKNNNFKIEQYANAYGFISNDSYVTLKMGERSANFFKREGKFNQANFDFISEEADSTIIVKMYYNHMDEVVRLVQNWMPEITILEDSPIVDKIYHKIEKNHNIFKLNRGNN